MAKKKRFYQNTEARDSSMVPDSSNSFANLPQEVIFKAYPSVKYSVYNLDDTIKGMDAQMSGDASSSKRKSGKTTERF